jgi:hypothetical protein
MMQSNMDMDEFEFPDEKESEQETKSQQDEDFEIEVEDDTPEPDRGRQPLPMNVVEDLEKDELEEYSDNVKTKLKQLKKVWHDERREKERAYREQQEAIEFAKKVMHENNSLKGRLSHGEKTFIDTYKSAAELELDSAKKAYKEAYDRGDPDQILEAQDRISQANYKLQKAREYVPSLQYEESVVQSAPEAPAPRVDPKSAAWQERNQWFGRDPEMTSLALGLHQKLVSEYGESYPSTDEYWNKVDTTIRRRFPEYFEGMQEETQSTNRQRTEKAPTVVAPATRSTASKKVKIKQSTVNMIKKLGITPEQYIREQRKLESKNG